MTRRRIITSWVVLAAGVGVGVSTVAMAQFHDHRPAKKSSICGTYFDPYKHSIAVDRSCGLKVYPLTRVQKLPSGGKKYIYETPSGESDTLVPPPHFNPLTATDAELKEYGFPPRDAHDPNWVAAMRHWKRHAQPPKFLVELPNASDGGAAAGSNR